MSENNQRPSPPSRPLPATSGGDAAEELPAYTAEPEELNEQTQPGAQAERPSDQKHPSYTSTTSQWGASLAAVSATFGYHVRAPQLTSALRLSADTFAGNLSRTTTAEPRAEDVPPPAYSETYGRITDLGPALGTDAAVAGTSAT